jgi:hypothetical protein
MPANVSKHRLWAKVHLPNTSFAGQATGLKGNISLFSIPTSPTASSALLPKPLIQVIEDDYELLRLAMHVLLCSISVVGALCMTELTA